MQLWETQISQQRHCDDEPFGYSSTALGSGCTQPSCNVQLIFDLLFHLHCSVDHFHFLKVLIVESWYLFIVES